MFVKKQLESRTAFHFVAVATDDGVPANRSLGVKVRYIFFPFFILFPTVII